MKELTAEEIDACDYGVTIFDRHGREWVLNEVKSWDDFPMPLWECQAQGEDLAFEMVGDTDAAEFVEIYGPFYREGTNA
ncbi:hypothetical protein NSA19_01065 [Actinomyces bowdenii]|uniref:hypothetical protein n=1 Tax=Actinomyces bowdenii TaxID=131109 RepID=UPI00214B2D5F|nr:hypothetical protein [Actinomyces bowdenii]MCR2051467.1 hypothetical protein [Actinomyces bowdenii]